MRGKTFVAAVAVLALVGCSRQQEATVENAAENIGENIGAAANTAVKEAGKELSDAGITLKVKTAMEASDKLDVRGIDVDTENKVVYLRGWVPSAQQKALAESITRNTVASGTKIVNTLEVRAPARATPQAKATPGAEAASKKQS